MVDAAHIHSPTGGQGANTGMQDGVRRFRLVLYARVVDNRLCS